MDRSKFELILVGLGFAGLSLIAINQKIELSETKLKLEQCQSETALDKILDKFPKDREAKKEK